MSTLRALLAAVGAAVRFGGGTEEGARQYEDYDLDAERQRLGIVKGRAGKGRRYGQTVCPKCGKHTSRESRYCQNCGHVPAGGFK